MATTKWTNLSTSTYTALSTELNSLGSGSLAISASPLSNDADGEQNLYGIWELNLAAQGTNRTGDLITVWLLPTMDGTNYSYGGSSLEPSGSNWKFEFQIDTGALAARRIVVDGIQVPPTDFHTVVKNSTGQAFASSGNTLKVRFYGVRAA